MAPAGELVRAQERVEEALKRLDCRLPEIFMTLSFLALEVIPELKLTDMGLVDVAKQQIVPLFTGL
jgi:adenine deaminase